MMKRTALAVLLSLSLSAIMAQNSYLPPKVVGQPTPKKTIKKTTPLSFKPIDQTVGSKYMLMPQNESPDQIPSYPTITTASGGTIDYKDNMGKILTLTRFVDYKGEFKDSQGSVCYAAVSDSCFDKMAYLPDIDSARSLFLNKTLWLKTNSISTGEQREDRTIDKIKGFKVKVIDIVVGYYDFAPARFILQLADGGKGFCDVTVSNTNINSQLKGTSGFYDSFWLTDPQLTYHFSPHTWSLIRNEKVGIGMTKKEVIMSWGEPDKINTSAYSSGVEEQWVFGETDPRYVYFQHGVVSAIN